MYSLCRKYCIYKSTYFMGDLRDYSRVIPTTRDLVFTRHQNVTPAKDAISMWPMAVLPAVKQKRLGYHCLTS
jgi:hypothetical protein